MKTSLSKESLPFTLFKSYPVRSKEYVECLHGHIDEIIQKHGVDEWKYTTLTTEIHNHIGIYSIIGAKMGLRAMELLHCQRGKPDVKAYLMMNPPQSCVIDGIQVSTGCTFGNGKFHLNANQDRVKADFIYQESVLTMRIKDEIVTDIKNIIDTLKFSHGGFTDAYFTELNHTAIQKWKEYDRNFIFDETINYKDTESI